MLLLFTAVASAFVYLGSPSSGGTCCGYMAEWPVDDVHWDGNDPSPWNACDYLKGDASHSFAEVTWECEDQWLSIAFGPDVEPGTGWSRKIYVISDGVQHESLCTLSYDGVPFLDYEVFPE